MIGAFLATHIKKMHAPLKEEAHLHEVLKRRLTKKEFKILVALCQKEDIEVLCQKLSLDKKRYKEIKMRLLRKINFHDLKEELLDKEA